MTSAENSLLPREATALVHHIELNRAGWWEKTVDRLLLAAIWLSDSPPDAKTIQATLKSDFRLSLSAPKVESALRSLEGRKILVQLDDGLYRIPNEQRTIFEAEIAAAETAEKDAKDVFYKLVTDMDDQMQPVELWSTFQEGFLAPLISAVGANAYRLVSGEQITVDSALFEGFLNGHSVDIRDKLRAVVTKFLDPKNPKVCAHISRMLHARFCVEASGLPDDVLSKLNASVGKQIRLRIFVDTNFLFSLLELHENPSNAAAHELRELIAQLKGNPRIDLVIAPNTIDEAKSSIAHTRDQLCGLPASPNFTGAALQARFSGMAIRFLTERLQRKGRLTSEEWFDPYLNDFIPIAKSKGVELFNEKVDGYSTRQDVIDDILAVRKYEEGLPEARRKSYPKVAHDMVLWHFVNDKRSAYIESPIDAEFWILTVDFRFIGFDEHKQRHSNAKVPLCIHPSTLIQLLQFWVPRTKEFEEAMLGSLRLPFLFQDFDAEGEQTSLKILKGIGRFEGSAQLPQSTITEVMLNEGLRSRMRSEHSEEAEIVLIRDALVEEMRLQAEAGAQKVKDLHQAALRREVELATIAEQKQAAEAASALSRTQRDEVEATAKRALAERNAELESVKNRLKSMEESERLREETEMAGEVRRNNLKAAGIYLLCLLVVVCFSIVMASYATQCFPSFEQLVGPLPAKGLTGIVSFVLGHLLLEFSIGRKPPVSQLRPFLQIKRLRNFLWMIVILGFVGGVLGNLYANKIQKNLDDRQQVQEK